ncbi:hypothetical protein NLI96_g8688 [Meripilus lineatus]|uniref:Nephrocystin 3-like N-terminal domain-containing protein n=1 Tax=Meripilus lineatus TaxID=2056292 RepID=A0AAD5YFZ8_9APHY|nr:hypothetical protein NLI96_g8688 [Physisporinus lineatus]
MDVFGTVGTAVSLLEACGKLVIALNRYINEVKLAKGKAEGLKEQVLGVQDVLTRIKQVYDEAQTQAEQFSAQGHSSQGLWFTEIANDMKKNQRVEDIINHCDTTFKDVLELLERSLGPMEPTSSPLNPDPQTHSAQLGDQKTPFWRVWKAYLQWPFQKKEVETLIGEIRQYVQGLNDLHRTYQEFANRRTQATEEILAYTKKKEQEDEQRRIEEDRRHIEEEQRREKDAEQRRQEEEKRRREDEQRHREEEERRREDEQRRRDKEQQEKLSAMVGKLGDPLASEHLSRHTMWCDKRTKGTCQWIIEDQAFRKWKDGAGGGCLWLYGGPGTGKTFLASAVIEELKKSGPVLFVYCDSKCTTARAVLELLAAQSLRQIGKRSTASAGWRLRPAVNFDFSEEFSALEHKDSYSLDDIPELITKVIKIFEAPFIVVDALDECPDRPETSRLIHTLLPLAKSGLNVFLTSREERSFFDWMKDIPENARIRLRNQNAPDIQLHITHTIDGSVSVRSDLPDLEKQQIHSTIEDRFKEKAEGGMFLLVDRLLEPVVTRATIEEITEDLQNLPADCEDLWLRILTSIDKACGKNDKSRRRISLALTWLMGTVVPLELEVLNEVLKGDEGGEEPEGAWEEEMSPLDNRRAKRARNPEPDQSIVNELRSLVVYDTRSRIIRFSHSTIQEYLKGDHPLTAFQIKNAREEVAIYLLRYLRRDRKKRNPLRWFVMHEWVSHLKSLTPEKDDCYNLFMELTRHPTNDQRWWRIQRADTLFEHRFTCPIIEGPVSTAIRCDFNWMLERMARKDPDLIQTKLPRHAPVLCAIERGNSEAFKTLYEFGNFDINAMIKIGIFGKLTSPLRIAIESGSSEILDAILSKKPDIHLTFPPYNRTFLHIACSSPSPDILVISRLLEHHDRVDINTKDTRGRTPFHCLAENINDRFGGLEVFKLLIRHGSNAHAMTNRGQTALAIAERFKPNYINRVRRKAVVDYLRSVTNLPESSHRSSEMGRGDSSEQ